jgi:hypothetical protein
MAEVAARQGAVQGEYERYGGVEMSAGNGPQRGDEHHQDGAGGDCVGEQGEGGVVCESLRHDAGADNRCGEQTSSERFGGEPAGRCWVVH